MSGSNERERRHILSLLIQHGLRVRDIARQIGCSDHLVGRVIAGSRRNPSVQNGIARALNMKRADLFDTGQVDTDAWPPSKWRQWHRKHQSAQGSG